MSEAELIEAKFCEIGLSPNDFDHAAWDEAQRVTIQRRWSGQEAPESQHAEARIVWTNTALLTRFVCAQEGPVIASSDPRPDRKTLGLWKRDVCEIFVAPDPNAPNSYFEFEAAPTGEWVDLGIEVGPDGRETDWEFRSGMTTAARLRDEELTIVIRIPWSEKIPRPNRGDEWRVNLFRCVGTGNERYLAWQPTFTEEPYFHVPEVFGWLRFK